MDTMLFLPTLVGALTFFMIGCGQASPGASPYIHKGSRIMVAKVFPRDEDALPQEKYFKMVGEAGFDVIIPTKGRDNPKLIDKCVGLAGKYGMKHMLVRRGTEPAGDSGEQFVWQNGVFQAMARPFSEKLWKDTILPRALAHARRSQTTAAVGMWLDFELYERNDQQNVQWYTYDDLTITEFSADIGREIPHLPPEDRYDWFDANGLLDAFHTYQRDRYRDQVRNVRKQIDKIDPRFQFGLYPGPMQPFLPIACKELATAAAPIVLTPADTYARAIATLPDSICLDSSRVWCQRSRVLSKTYDFPHLVLGGIMPGHQGADPVWNAKNAYTVASGVDGYWLFFQQVLPGTTIENYMTLLAAANFALDHGDSSWMNSIGPTIPDRPLGDSGEQREPVDIGIVGSFEPSLIEGRHPYERVGEFSAENLRRFQVIILQNFNVCADQSTPLNKLFQDYVAQGGGLMLTHDTTYFMGSPFPEIVKDYLLQPPLWHHVDNADMKLTADVDHPIIASFPEAMPFKSRFTDYLPLAKGSEGTVLVENDAGQAIYVAGRYGKGRVLFAGSYFWYGFAKKPYDRPEDRLFLNSLEWLMANDKNPKQQGTVGIERK